MLKAIQVITRDDIEARIFPVQQGYRVEVSTALVDYWHPGVFPHLQQLQAWLTFELAKLDSGFSLSGDWMMLEGDFDGNGRYREWFICQQKNWQGYDPFTNRCYTAPTRSTLTAKIDRIESDRCAKIPGRISTLADSN
jgi:hypothetical protein